MTATSTLVKTQVGRLCVTYRKLCGGTDGEAGSQFVERILTIVTTCRQQETHVLDDLTRCYPGRSTGTFAHPRRLDR